MAAPTDEQTPATPAADPFTAMFDQLSALGEAPVPADLTAAPAPETPAAPDAPETPAAPDAPETPVTSEAPAPVPTPAPLSDEEILQRMAALVNKAPAPTPAPEPEPTPAAPEPAAFTTEETETLNKYLEEWPEVANAEAMIRRNEYQQLVQHIFAEVRKEFEPIRETVKVLATELQLSQLKTVVPEYDAVDPDAVIAWVKEQPAYLQPAYQHVIDKGTPDEVADLVQRYRQGTGVAVTPPAPSVAPTKQPDTALPADAKQAAASLAPVSSKRSVAAPSGEPADFDSAFAVFAAKP